MEILDGHMHTRHAPGDWFVRCADARGLSAYAVLSLSCMASFGGGRNNAYCLAAKRADPARAYFFAGLEHPCADYAAHVQRWLNLGADGIKLIETKPTVFAETGVDLSDAQFDGMFALLEALAVPIIWHVGDPAAFWRREDAPHFAFENGWFYGEGGHPPLARFYGMAESVLARHPALRVAFAHLYFCSDDRAHAEHLLNTYPNVRLDITPGTEMYQSFFSDRDAWREFFLRHQDRIHLGSDTDMGDAFSGETPLALALESLSGGHVSCLGCEGPGLDLPHSVIQKVVFENFRAFAGAAPKKLPG